METKQTTEQAQALSDARDANLWRSLLSLPGARRRIWVHVLDESLKDKANSIEDAILSAKEQA